MIKFISFLVLFILLHSVNAEETHLKIDDKYRQFMTDYCIECHNAKKTKGKTRLDKEGFSFDILRVQDADKWQQILTAINAKEMPPEDEKQPGNLEKADFLEMLSNKMVEAREFFRDTGGKTSMRRLNRREYTNTIKDFLGVTPDVSGLPEDNSSFGFDTDGSSLFMSSDQIEQYLQAARKSLSSALNTKKTKVIKTRIEPESKNKGLQSLADRYKDKFDRANAYESSKDPNKNPKDFGLRDKRDALSGQRAYGKFYNFLTSYLDNPYSKSGLLLGTERRTQDFSLPLAGNGRYKIRAKVGFIKGAPEMRSFLDVVLSKSDINLYERVQTFKVTKSPEEGQIIEITLDNENDSKLVFREKSRDSVAKNIQAEHKKINKVQAIVPAIWVDWIEWEGPFQIEKPDLIQEISKAFSTKLTDETIKKLIAKFALAAFRGDLPDTSYIDGLFEIYQDQKRLGKKPHEAIIEPLSIVLASPGFIYVSEKSNSGKPQKLSQRELAVRLAYFLWSSTPDEELLKMAEEGKLSDETLTSQVERMLKDSRADNFYRDFTHQWLDLEHLYLFEFNTQLYPWFDNTLKALAAEEVNETFKLITNEGLSSRNLLKSDFVVINALLASHYGIPNVEGGHFRKVKLAEGSVRGGFTGMAAIHAMGSDGKKTSPVERGAWVLRKVLNQPPPPAPANVPQLARLEGKNFNARQMLQAHQTEAQCAHCHKKIDPIGFGLENFDPTGKWRTKEVVHGVKIKKGDNGRVQLTSKQLEELEKANKDLIDASGSIHNGPKFKNYFELRDIFADNLDNFNRGLIKELLSYSLCRSAGFSDQELIDDLLKHMKRNGNSVRSLIHALAQSEAFKTKK